MRTAKRRRHKGVRPPISYLGGKSRMVHRLLSLMPLHRTYVEVFGGSGALLLAKASSPVEIYNDIHSGLVDMYRVIRGKKFERFLEQAELILHSREEHTYFKNKWKELPRGSVERAVSFYVQVAQQISGGSGWGYGIVSNVALTRLRNLTRLPAVHERLRGVTIENLGFVEVMEKYDTKRTFFYLDPPYLPETRTEWKCYQHEMTREDHAKMLRVVRGLAGKAMISGYASELYNKKLKDKFVRYDFRSYVTPGVKRMKGGRKRIESLWVSK